MEKLERLKAKRHAISEKIDALLADDIAELTEEQRAEHDRLVEEFDKISEVIRIEEAHVARKQELASREAESEAKRLADEKAAKAAEEKARRVVPGPARKTDADQPRVVRRDDQGRVTATMEPTDEQVVIRFDEHGGQPLNYRQLRKRHERQLHDAGYRQWGEFKSAREFVTEGLLNHTHRDFRERYHKHFAAVQGMSEGVGSDGGYTVMPEFAAGIIDRVYSNSLWSMTDNYSVSGNSLTFTANAETSRATGSRHGGLRGYWLGEGQTKTKSKPTFRQITLKLAKLAVVVYLTDELIQDTGMALEQYIARKASEEFNFLIGDALINGDGVGKPLGILNAPSLVTVDAEAGQLADTLETENVIKMYSRFFAPNRSRLTWLHNQDIESELFTMTMGVGTGGVVTYMPPGGLANSPNATLMGRPMIATEFNPTLGDVGDLLAADMSQVLSISKGGLMQASSIHVEFLSDQTALRFVMRLNATPWENAAITPFKGSNSQSSFVALAAR